MKNIISITLILLTSITVFGQNFTGTVLDKESKEPIPYAQIYFVDLKTGTTTDNNGIFKIEHFNQKTIHIQITFVGYNIIDEIINLDTTKEKIFYLEQGHFDLEEVVVSAPAGRLQGENIVSIEHKKITELQQTSPLTLSEAISNISGVDQITTGAGIGKPVVRGLSGNRIVTYAQGIRIENQQWGDEHGLGVGEVGIESVEVIKGPASLLYGSDALGGVLYFIDERYASQNRVEGFAQIKFLSNTLGSISNVGFKINRGNLKFNLFGAYSSQADYQVPNFDRVFNTRFDEKNIKSSIGFNTKNWISNIRYSYLQNNYGIVEDATYTNATQRKLILPFQTIDNHNLSFENIIFTGNSKLNFTLGYTNNYRKEFEDDSNNHALGLKLNTFTYNLKWYSPSFKDQFDFIVGSQGMAQENKNNGDEILIPDATTIDFGAFVLGNLNFNKLQLQGGIRADYRNIDTKEMIIEHHEEEKEEEEGSFPAIKNSYSGLTFSGGAVYKMGKTKLRANISSGFRAPNTTELLSDGVHHGTNRYIKGDVNLKNENATQIDFSFDYKDEHLSFSVNPFYNAIQNYIFLSPTEISIDNNHVFEYLQTNAFLYGGELGFHYHPHKIHWLHLESNLSTVIAEDRNGNPLPLIPQTKLSSTISTEFSHKGKVKLKNVFVQHIYKFKQNRTSIFETPTNDYNLINIGLNFEITTKNNPIEITTGINNLLNTKFIDHLSLFKTLEIPNQGINFYMGIKVKLNKELKEERG
ncbi:MAG: TonB-dependent receptor [Melioribacteraceae bacterium]|nr:TonB-dependent receptor [Melioribacteraceae bacterium]